MAPDDIPAGSSEVLPVSAILPVYNCRERLERHLRGVLSWASLVREWIVVDSGSTDGTRELAEETLSPYGARLLLHPPGLYQSWNAGIAAASSPWCYLSTVEDPITPSGLAHLLEVALRHDADAVVSPPDMRNHDGSAPVGERMPANRLAEAFLKSGLPDRMLGRAETIATLCGFLPHGLLGSSASNLYRTPFLQAHPFPADFGHCGDTAWGVTVAPFVKLAFTPRSCARFHCQTNFRAEDPERQHARHRRLAEAARRALEAAAPVDPDCAVMLGWFNAADHSAGTLWNWLAEQHAYQEHLTAKYEGGILQYLKRALRDEWKKFRGRGGRNG
jgi:glycosyltransferase involved in cell wall biosynthesis